MGGPRRDRADDARDSRTSTHSNPGRRMPLHSISPCWWWEIQPRQCSPTISSQEDEPGIASQFLFKFWGSKSVGRMLGLTGLWH